MKLHLLALLLCVLMHVRAEEAGEEELTIASAEVKYTPPSKPSSAFLAETFDNGLGSHWVKSAAKKDGADEAIAKYNGEWEVKEADSPVVKGDVGLVLTTKARHAAITSKLDKPFTFTGKPLVVQYEVKYQNGMDCGGSYMKLLSDVPGLDPKQVTDKSGYTIMFGPDACGMDKKLHFIIRHKNPKTGEFEEKHAKKPTGAMDYYGDKKTHLFRLTVNSDSTWEVHVDETMANSGSLLEDMTPPVNPPKEIDDPDDFKPATWDDREKIPDPDATKPIDWDEDAPEFIVDEEAVKPAGWLDDEEELVADPDAEMPVDWDEEMDGEWEAPKIDNPLCKDAPGCGEWKRPNKRNPEYRGKWKPEMIANPDYSGVWAPHKIPNPDFFEDLEPYKMTPIGAVAFELWSMTDAVMFDNILITDDVSVADVWTEQTWHVKRDAELAESARNASPLLQPVWDALEDKPWLWAVLIISLLVPIGLVIYCCTGSKGDGSAERKKTDAPTPDDAVADDGEAADDSEAADDGAAGDSSPPARSASPSKRSPSPRKGEKRSASPSKSGRAALSEPVGDEEEEEGTADEAPSDQQEESVEEATAESQEEAEPTTRKSPRKRKPRKE